MRDLSHWLVRLAVWQASLHPYLFVLGVLARTVTIVCNGLQLFETSRLFDAMTARQHDAAMQSLLRLGGYHAVITVLKALDSYVNGILAAYIQIQTRLAILETFLYQVARYDTEHDAKREFNQLYQASGHLGWIMATAVPGAVATLATLAVGLWVGVSFSPPWSVWVIGLVPSLVSTWVGVVESRVRRTYSERIVTSETAARVCVHDLLVSKDELVAWRATAFGVRRAIQVSIDVWAHRLRAAQLLILAYLTRTLFGVVHELGVLVVCAVAVVDGRMTIGDVVAITRFMVMLQAVVATTVQMYTAWGDVVGTVATLFRWTEQDTSGPPHPRHGATRTARALDAAFLTGAAWGGRSVFWQPLTLGGCWRWTGSRDYVRDTTPHPPPKTCVLAPSPQRDQAPQTDPAPPPRPVSVIATGLRLPGVKRVYGVSLVVRPGEIVLLCGENGGGKSTMLKVLAGVLDPEPHPTTILRIDETNMLAPPDQAEDGTDGAGTSGTRDVSRGMWPTRSEPRRPPTAVLMQTAGTAIVPGTLRDNVLLGWSSSAAVPDDAVLDDFVSTSEFPWNWDAWPQGWDTLVHTTFSGGELQRMRLLRVAMCTDAQLVLLDEPLTALDDVATDWLMRWLRGPRTQRRTSLMTDRHGTVRPVRVSQYDHHFARATVIIACHHPDVYEAHNVPMRVVDIGGGMCNQGAQERKELVCD